MRFLPVMGDGDVVVACSDIGFDVSHFNIIARKFKFELAETGVTLMRLIYLTES